VRTWFGESDLFQQGLVGQWGEAAQQKSGCGLMDWIGMD